MIEFSTATVSELVNSIKGILEESFHEVVVQGEVTNLSPSAAGHYYFTLSDEEASISCALFRGDALRNPLIRTLKDGDKILVLGPVSVYQKRGTFQLLAKRILPAGEGKLKIQYEKLKSKLSAEGLFDIERKKKLPIFPKRIVVITAEHGAALQDFLNVMKRRSLWFDIIIVPAIVQGEAAPKSLIDAIKKAEKLEMVDVIVLTRGGGSLEDLWAFNNEELVRTISACKVPTISAVGHQVDYTLSDYVADYRSETPTAAAETLSQPQTELKGRMIYCSTHLKSGLFKQNQQIQLMSQKFHPRELLGLVWGQLQLARKNLSDIRFIDRGHELMGIREASQSVDEFYLRLTHSLERKTSDNSSRLTRLEQVLEALNPKNVLNRGFSFVQLKNGAVISSIKDYNKISPEQNIDIHFYDGIGKARKD